jgi:hypothetical protein
MTSKVALAILYFVSIGYVYLIVSPAIYCLQHGCKGPEGDVFMPAFFLTPLGIIAVALSLHHSIQQIKKRQSWSWLFWPLAIIFAIVLLAAVIFIAMLIYELATHRK